MNNPLPKTLYLFICYFLRDYKSTVIIFLTLGILAGFLQPINSFLIKYIIDSLHAAGEGDVSFLILPAALIVLNFIVCDNITWRSISYLHYRHQLVIKNRIISQTFAYVLDSSHQFFQDNFSGRIASQIDILADNIEYILHNIAANFIRGGMLLIVAFASMYYVNVKFALTLAIWFFAFSCFSIYLSKKYLVKLSDSHAASESVISGQLVDSITNSSNIRIFAKKFYEVSHIDKFLLITKKTFRDKQFFLIALNSIQGLLIAIMLGSMLYFLIQLRGQQLISVGDFALILALSMDVAYTTWFTMSQVDEFFEAIGKCRQSLAYLIVDHEIGDKEDATDLMVTNGQITFTEVEFHYKGVIPLFQNKSITIQPGQKVGLVGYSGSGKSTFVNLILRLYDVTGGSILIDDQDIRSCTLSSLHSNIAMIPQDPSLFHRSLMENIRYGRINATDEEVIKAAKKAHAHEFISRLSEGYNALVGERGVKLSGGQRQRIAIARAILKDGPILILDEATSQLDSITEQLIQESLWELMQNKTTIVIAHRLSTLLHMDRILVFEQGKIIEDGPHKKLLESGGHYKMLWDAQVGGFLPDKRAY